MTTRRKFLTLTAIGGTGALVGCSVKTLTNAKQETEGEEEVSPSEDLMREHGILKRVLLIYEEGIRRIETKQDLPLVPLQESANIIRTFVEDYHEKLEEDFLFPRFRQANTLVDLVHTLERQHQAGRRLTDRIISLTTSSALRTPPERYTLRDTMRLFIRMYNPHEAREDTVLFPAFRKIVTSNEYDSLGEEFEDREHDLFGKEGFEGVVEQVAKIEKKLGIYDLSKFTPRI